VNGLVAAEIRKLRTVRTTWVLTALGWGLVVLSSAVFLFAEQLSGPFTGTDAEVAAAVDQIGGNAVIILIVAILLVTTEFRHGTIGRTFQLTPSRTRVLTAKMVTGAIYATAFFASSLVLVAAAIALAGAVNDVTPQVGSETLTAVWQGPVGLALNAILGVAIGALLRSQVVTISLAPGVAVRRRAADQRAAALGRTVAAVPGAERDVPVRRGARRSSRGTPDAARPADRPRGLPRLRPVRRGRRRGAAAHPRRLSLNPSFLFLRGR
jgi:ABC-2 type transport system permease protein